MRKYNFKETENNLHEENRKTTSLLLKETKRNLLPRNKKFTFKKREISNITWDKSVIIYFYLKEMILYYISFWNTFKTKMFTDINKYK